MWSTLTLSLSLTTIAYMASTFCSFHARTFCYALGVTRTISFFEIFQITSKQTPLNIFILQFDFILNLKNKQYFKMIIVYIIVKLFRTLSRITIHQQMMEKELEQGKVLRMPLSFSRISSNALKFSLLPINQTFFLIRLVQTDNEHIAIHSLPTLTIYSMEIALNKIRLLCLLWTLECSHSNAHFVYFVTYFEG